MERMVGAAPVAAPAPRPALHGPKLFPLLAMGLVGVLVIAAFLARKPERAEPSDTGSPLAP